MLASTLVLTLLVSLVALSGMRASRLESSMVSNSKSYRATLINAVSTVTRAEQDWKKRVRSCLWDVSACDDDVLARLDQATANTDGQPESEPSRGPSSENGKSYSYTLEYLGRYMVPGDSYKQLAIYRFRAAGTTRAGTAGAKVESLFQICINADGSPCPDT